MLEVHFFERIVITKFADTNSRNLATYPAKIPNDVFFSGASVLQWKNHGTTPRKINMEHNHGGLEDHFPF